MKKIEIENKMYQIAIELIKSRYPIGWGGAAVIRTDKNNFLTSVSLSTSNDSAQLCIEVGAMCEAHKYNERVTHCLCVVRDNEKAEFKILSPCGICQERLRYWGTDVLVGVTTKNNDLQFVRLNEFQPYHWTNAFPSEELQSFIEK